MIAVPSGVRVVVQSASPWFGETLAARLRDDPRIAGARSVATTEQWLDGRKPGTQEVLLVDAGDDPAEARAVCEAAAAVAGVHVVAMGVGEDDPRALGLIEAGALGLVAPEASFAHVADVVAEAGQGRPSCSPRTLARVLDQIQRRDGQTSIEDPPEPLTDRQAEIAEWVAAGATNKQIARRLNLRPATVRNHVREVLRKGGLARRREVASRLPFWRTNGEEGVGLGTCVAWRS
ncbi:MAG: response regulator transcription factor [Pirellulales bacterium]|nr:response regulator transcription factor [Pirellulales bacterium]